MVGVYIRIYVTVEMFFGVKKAGVFFLIQKTIQSAVKIYDGGWWYSSIDITRYP